MIEPPARTNEDCLVVHLLGSGYGESQVVLFPGPERCCMVVDSCVSKKGGRNLTAKLLRGLGRTSVDLLVVTHADADHIEGMPALIDEFKPELVWYSPFPGSLRALVAQWRRNDPKNKGFLELDELGKRIKELREQDRAEMVLWSSRPWGCCPGGCIVEPIAPVSEEDAALGTKLSKMLKREEGKRWIVSDHGSAVLDGKKGVGDKPNTLSLALTIHWNRHRILLAGDVEKAQWSKILKKLARPTSQRLDRIRELDAVKVSHHGSEGAFHEEAWALHRKDDGSTIALIAPFDDTVKLPHAETLRRLLRHAGRLGMTTNAGGGFERAEEAGWVAISKDEIVMLRDRESLVTIVFSKDRPTELRTSHDARIFMRPETRVGSRALDET